MYYAIQKNGSVFAFKKICHQFKQIAYLLMDFGLPKGCYAQFFPIPSISFSANREPGL